MNNCEAIATPARRRLYPATELRQLRLSRGLKLSDVAARAGLSLTRASYIERAPSLATAEELSALRRAIDELAAELETTGRTR